MPSELKISWSLLVPDTYYSLGHCPSLVTLDPGSRPSCPLMLRTPFMMTLASICMIYPVPWPSQFLDTLFLFFLKLITLYIFVTLCTVAPQAPLSTGFPRQESWSGLPLPTPGDPHPGMEPTSLASPALAGGFFNTRHNLGSLCQGLFKFTCVK